MAVRKLRVYGWGTQNNGCSKYRIWQPLAMLDKLGLAEVRREPDQPQPVSAERIRDIFAWADVVVAQPFSELWAAGLLFGAREAFRKDGVNKKIVVDLDDNIYEVHPLNVGIHEGKLIYLANRYSGEWERYWEILDVPKGEELKCARDLNGTLFKDGDQARFLRNKEPDGRLVVTAMLQAADMVTTTNEELRDVFRKVTSAPVVVLPNCLDFKEWESTTRPRPEKETTWIGWCGSVSHYPDLKPIMPALDSVMKTHDAKVHIMGSSFDYLFPPKPEAKRDAVSGYHGEGEIDPMFQIKYEDCGERWPGRMAFHPPVPIQQYVPWFAGNFKADIAIAPLEENAFNRAKSELKWVENAALKIPTVASKVGPYQRTIRHGEDGLLAGTPAAFRKGITELVEDAGLRKRLGEAAHERVREEYDAEKRAPEWLRAYEAIA